MEVFSNLDQYQTAWSLVLVVVPSWHTIELDHRNLHVRESSCSMLVLTLSYHWKKLKNKRTSKQQTSCEKACCQVWPPSGRLSVKFVGNCDCTFELLYCCQGDLLTNVYAPLLPLALQASTALKMVCPCIVSNRFFGFNVSKTCVDRPTTRTSLVWRLTLWQTGPPWRFLYFATQ